MRISFATALSLSIVVVGCAKSADKAVDSVAATPPAAMTPAPAPAPAPTISLAEVAGKWNIVSTPTEGTDTSSTRGVVIATGDTTGWKLELAKRKAIPLHVSTSGDSIMATSDKYESVRRKGVQVTTTNVFRLQGGKLVGQMTAHYSSKGADSVVHFRSEGTKAP